MNQKKNIDKKIADAKKELETYKTANVFNLTEKDFDLYSIVHHYHSLFEQIFYGFFADYFILIIKRELSNKNKVNVKDILFRMLDDVAYYKKIMMLYEFKLISNELKSKLLELNTIRVNIAHPVSHLSAIGKYKEKGNYLKMLQLIIKIIFLLSAEIRSRKRVLIKT